MKAKFILSKSKVVEQYDKLKELGLKVSYSYKTNRDVGNVLQGVEGCDFSIHAFEEVDMIEDKSRIWFFSQAWNLEQVKCLLLKGVDKFVIDSEEDLWVLLAVVEELKKRIVISFRMKFQERRVNTGKYFVYGLASGKVNELISKVSGNEFVDKIGIHVHRKSQNTSEWEIREELEDAIDDWGKIGFVNIGGGLPAEYRSSSVDVMPYIFGKLSEVKEWLSEKGIGVFIEPGRFIAAPAVKLETEIIQIHERNIVVNTTIYNCALDGILTGTKMLVEGESDEGRDYLIKGNSPTRDDIFRYRVRLGEKKIGDKIVFLGAGAYNYSTDFFGGGRLESVVVD
tara:strand:- start:196 stop:1215 length:1020 start_codon:yes stop_codon:yes gene_type:complete